MELSAEVTLHSCHIGMERDRAVAHRAEDRASSSKKRHGGSTTHLVHGTCVMERIWRERKVIIGVPVWDYFVMGMMTAAVTIGYPLHHIGCAMAPPSKTPIYRLCVCLCGLFWAHFCCQLYGTAPLRLCAYFCMDSDDECSLTINWWRSIGFTMEICLHSDRINL